MAAVRRRRQASQYSEDEDDGDQIRRSNDSLRSDYESESDEDRNVEGEESRGKSQEKSPEADDDEVKTNPAYVPRAGYFYEHDVRGADDAEQSQEPRQSSRQLWLDQKQKWSHDRYDPGEQAPKSRGEIAASYGYDIRSKDRCPDDPLPELRKRGPGRRNFGDFVPDDGGDRRRRPRRGGGGRRPPQRSYDDRDFGGGDAREFRRGNGRGHRGRGRRSPQRDSLRQNSSGGPQDFDREYPPVSVSSSQDSRQPPREQMGKPRRGNAIHGTRGSNRQQERRSAQQAAANLSRPANSAPQHSTGVAPWKRNKQDAKQDVDQSSSSNTTPATQQDTKSNAQGNKAQSAPNNERPATDDTAARAAATLEKPVEASSTSRSEQKQVASSSEKKAKRTPEKPTSNLSKPASRGPQSETQDSKPKRYSSQRQQTRNVESAASTASTPATGGSGDGSSGQAVPMVDMRVPPPGTQVHEVRAMTPVSSAQLPVRVPLQQVGTAAVPRQQPPARPITGSQQPQNVGIPSSPIPRTAHIFPGHAAGVSPQQQSVNPFVLSQAGYSTGMPGSPQQANVSSGTPIAPAVQVPRMPPATVSNLGTPQMLPPSTVAGLPAPQMMPPVPPVQPAMPPMAAPSALAQQMVPAGPMLLQGYVPVNPTRAAAPSPVPVFPQQQPSTPSGSGGTVYYAQDSPLNALPAVSAATGNSGSVSHQTASHGQQYTTYYSTEEQLRQPRSAATKRTKMAIPIVDPQSGEGDGPHYTWGMHSSEQSFEEDEQKEVILRDSVGEHHQQSNSGEQLDQSVKSDDSQVAKSDELDLIEEKINVPDQTLLCEGETSFSDLQTPASDRIQVDEKDTCLEEFSEGEKGEDTSVVADEIANLANQSGNVTQLETFHESETGLEQSAGSSPDADEGNEMLSSKVSKEIPNTGQEQENQEDDYPDNDEPRDTKPTVQLQEVKFDSEQDSTEKSTNSVEVEGSDASPNDTQAEVNQSGDQNACQTKEVSLEVELKREGTSDGEANEFQDASEDVN